MQVGSPVAKQLFTIIVVAAALCSGSVVAVWVWFADTVHFVCSSCVDVSVEENMLRRPSPYPSTTLSGQHHQEPKSSVSWGFENPSRLKLLFLPSIECILIMSVEKNHKPQGRQSQRTGAGGGGGGVPAASLSAPLTAPTAPATPFTLLVGKY